jgi:hypothetical protein
MLKVWLLVICLLAVPAWSAQTSAGKRFLFIVDTSAAMKPLDKPVRETLFDLIYSGVRGNMTNGDTYGVWLVGEQNDTSFPMEMWKDKHAVEIGAKAVSHLKDRGFKGRANLMQAMVDVNRIVKNVKDLNVILISNGDTPLVGTPFDEPINARFRELAPAMKAAKLSVNTALVAQDGKFVAWALNSPQFLIDIPYVAPKPKPVKVEPPVAAPVAALKPAKVVAPPRIASNPIIITKETVAEERRSYVASWTNTNTPIATPIALVATNAGSNSPATAATNDLANVATNQTNAVVANVPAPVNLITNVVPVTAAIPASTAETRPTNVAVAPAELPPVAPAAASNRSWSFILLCVAAGAGGAFFVLVGALLINRSRRREPSLISQAIARERMQAR